jgi:predicted deacylase
MRLDIRLETAWRAPEAILFGGAHGDELPTTRQQGA